MRWKRRLPIQPYSLFTREELASLSFDEFCRLAEERGADPDELRRIAQRIVDGVRALQTPH